MLFVEPISRKRKHCFINRNPKVSLQRCKKVSQVSLSSVQLVSVIDCCPKRCCQYANWDKVFTIRNEFWGQTLQNRTNYVYDTMLTAGMRRKSLQSHAMYFLLMTMRFALELVMKSMAFQKHHSIIIMSNLRVGFVPQCMVMMVS